MKDELGGLIMKELRAKTHSYLKVANMKIKKQKTQKSLS